MQSLNTVRGFTFIEIMVVVAILLSLAGIAVVSLSAMQERMLLNSAASNMAFHLEESKARSVAGLHGVTHGIYFTENSYVQFQGNDYDADDDTNIVHEIDGRLEITTDILDGEQSIIFSRMTGAVEQIGSVTVSLRSDPDNSRTIVIGEGGGISYE